MVQHLVDDLRLPGREREPGAVLLWPRRGRVPGLAEADTPLGVVDLAAQGGDLLVVVGVDGFHPARRQVVAQPAERLLSQLLRGHLGRFDGHARMVPIS